MPGKQAPWEGGGVAVKRRAFIYPYPSPPRGEHRCHLFLWCLYTGREGYWRIIAYHQQNFLTTVNGVGFLCDHFSLLRSPEVRRLTRQSPFPSGLPYDSSFFTTTIITCFFFSTAVADDDDIAVVVLFLLCIFSRSLFLYFRLRGFVLSLYPQHGHQRSFQLMKISHIWQRFCPVEYLPAPVGFGALWRMQMPLHVNFGSSP